MISEVNRLFDEAWPLVRAALDPPKPFNPNQPPSIRDWISWSSRVSPGFPILYDERPEMHFYANAAGMQPGVLMDGEYYTAIWGRVRVSLQDDSMSLEILELNPPRLGTVGMRPMSPAEVAIFEDKRVVEELARSRFPDGLSPQLEARVRAYYRQWCGFQGMTRQLEWLHPAFFKWLRAS